MVMLNLIKAVLFGIVEGITEWLPVSSTGHMILLDEIIRMDVTPEFWEMFLVVIQLGAIMAVVILFWNQIFPFDFSKKAREEHRVMRKDIWILWGKILIACVPAAIVGVLFDDVFDALFYNGPCVAIALIVFGIGFIIIENVNKNKTPKIDSLEKIDIKTALLIGIFQLIAAIFPGTSRSGSTILGGLMIGVSRTVAAEFTFFLAIPVMFGASLLKLLKFGLAFSGSELAILLVGTVVAFVVSILIIKFLLGYIRKHDFKVFGWYRIVLGIIVLAVFVMFR
ncbi:undecaprenyl-diphosphate phosphatase [Butyrivibrio sp. WCD3002]|uniref:undecaprenyl-diphosphate phosphatase n=1 Tax=Butyrivibrio sp. WCD3002 TaxID=1280676 RepID=UPI000559DF34|nr:undecaprenyl-diphosphate phosphatase [Butyrivibrio sp. WCD3002]